MLLRLACNLQQLVISDGPDSMQRFECFVLWPNNEPGDDFSQVVSFLF